MLRLGLGSLIVGTLVFGAPTTAMIRTVDSASPQPAGRPPARQQEPPFTNDAIVKLTQAGLDGDLIVAKVKQAPSENFDVSTEALIDLQKNKVAKEVIAAMLERVAARSTAAPPPPGAMPGPDQEPTQPREASAQESVPADAGSWYGWITDQRCGAKGAKPDHQSCAMRCMDRGSKVVFFNTADSKIYFLSSKRFSIFSWARFMGRKVKLTGKLNDGAIDVDTISSPTK
jgi:hypothetical protein